MKFVKGAPEPFTRNQKVELGLTKYISAKPSWSDCNAWATDIVITKSSSTHIDKGERVRGEGHCLIHKKRHSDDKVLMPKKMNFVVEVEDCKDEWGLPDIKVVAGVIDGSKD